MPSFIQKKAYLFLQLKVKGIDKTYEEYRKKRSTILEIACGTAKNKYKHLNTIVGIAIDSPKYFNTTSEDFILFDCEEWSDEQEKYYRDLNKYWRFFETDNLKMLHKKSVEFPMLGPSNASNVKIGRNSPCPCGSGKKYKKCCRSIKYN